MGAENRVGETRLVTARGSLHLMLIGNLKRTRFKAAG